MARWDVNWLHAIMPNLDKCVVTIITLWGWFSRDVLPVTCCKHGPPIKATVYFSKFSIAINILFNRIPFIQVKQLFRCSWQLFNYVPWQPVHSNGVILLAIMEWATHYPFSNTRSHISVNKTRRNRSVSVLFVHGLPCRVTNKAIGPQKWLNPRPTDSVFCLLSSSDHIFHTTCETMIKSYIRCLLDGVAPLVLWIDSGSVL